MLTLSKLPPELLRLFSLYLRTVDCSSMSLTCWRVYNAVVSVLFKSIRILDQHSSEDDLLHLFEKCPQIKSAARHVTLCQWDPDCVSATISTDIIYQGISSFPNITSLRLDINVVPRLCWMLRLHRLFHALRHKSISKLELKVSELIDSGSEDVSSLWQNPPIPYHGLSNLDDLRITLSMHPLRRDAPLWLGYVEGLILASKETLTTLSLRMSFYYPIQVDPLFGVLKELKQLEVLVFYGFLFPTSLGDFLPLVQPDACSKLRRIAWGGDNVIDVERRPNSKALLSRSQLNHWVPWKFDSNKEFACLALLEDLPFDGESDDSDYDPPSSSASSSNSSDYDSDTMCDEATTS